MVLEKLYTTQANHTSAGKYSPRQEKEGSELKGFLVHVVVISSEG